MNVCPLRDAPAAGPRGHHGAALGGAPKKKGRKRAHKSGWRKPTDKPKRPLSAYNIFFLHERERIVAAAEGGEPDQAQTADAARTLQRIMLKSRAKTKGEADRVKSSRVHVRTHGKISFVNLARTVGAKWKALDGATKGVYVALADKERMRYRKEVELWEAKKRQKEGATNASITVPCAAAQAPKTSQGAAVHASSDRIHRDPSIAFGNGGSIHDNCDLSDGSNNIRKQHPVSKIAQHVYQNLEQYQTVPGYERVPINTSMSQSVYARESRVSLSHLNRLNKKSQRSKRVELPPAPLFPLMASDTTAMSFFMSDRLGHPVTRADLNGNNPSTTHTAPSVEHMLEDMLGSLPPFDQPRLPQNRICSPVPIEATRNESISVELGDADVPQAQQMGMGKLESSPIIHNLQRIEASNLPDVDTEMHDFLQWAFY